MTDRVQGPQGDPDRFEGNWVKVADGPPLITTVEYTADDDDPEFDPYTLPPLTQEEIDAL